MAQEQLNGDENRVELQKNMSPLHVWALALGCILGWGCFVLPGTEFLPNAGPIASFIGFFIGAVMLVFVALSYGKMIANYPVAGGAFVYAYTGFGPTAAFICGWALVLGYVSIIALNGTALVFITRFLFPGVLEVGRLYAILGWPVYAGELAFVSIILFSFGYLNYRGGNFAGSVQFYLALALILGIAIFSMSALFTPTGAVENLQPYTAEGQSVLASIARIVAIAPWLYVGFDTIPQAAEEFDFSPKKANNLMVWAILLGALCYGVVTLATAYVLPYKELLASNPAWATGSIARLSMGTIGAYVLAIAVACAICTGINGFFIATTRLIFGMARAGFLPEWFSRVHTTYKSPHNAVVFATAVCLIAPWFGRQALDWIVSMSAIGTVVAYAVTCFATLRFLNSSLTEDNCPKAKLIAILGAMASLTCLGLLTIPGSPAAIQWESWVALIVWVVLGAIFYGVKVRELHSLSCEDLSFRILGDKDAPIFYKKTCD